jgi:hypothetical protein
VNAACLSIDPARVRVARSIASLARASARDGGPLVCVTGRALVDLADELGSYDAAARRLLTIATNVGRPLAVNCPTGPDRSQTMFVAPKDWTDERLRGWVAGRHAELEAMFGAAAVRSMEEL